LSELDTLANQIEQQIINYGRADAVVAFSGGVDSSVVLALAARALGRFHVAAVTAVSASYPAGELDEAKRQAEQLGVQFRYVRTNEVQQEAYAANGPMRCYHCKMELFHVISAIADGLLDMATVVLSGANGDDVRDFRPGLLANRRFHVRSPLLEASIGKSRVRALARHLGLLSADKPPLACLSSRVAYGIRITPNLLERIDKAEQMIHQLGFREVRARHFGAVVRIDVPAEDVNRLQRHAALVRSEITRLGWQQMAIGLAGIQSGALNASLPSDSVQRVSKAAQALSTQNVTDL
jgi:pyridinium-3,5-biscarboxylic acid mononucleotide sulfurtransferase